jgi:hypothetical protein
MYIKFYYYEKKVVKTIRGASPLGYCHPLFNSLKVMTVVNLYIYHVLENTQSNLEELESGKTSIIITPELNLSSTFLFID